MEAAFTRRNGVLNGRVLLLNQSYEPLTTCSVKKAVILIFLEKAELVAAKDSIQLHSVKRTFPFPAVVRLKSYIKVPFKKILLSRKNILKRDKHKCGYCGRGDLPLTIDHIIPKAKGGGETWENLVAACLPCNNKKGNRTPEEANLQLKTNPYKPNHIIFIKHTVNRIDETWRPYLFD